MTRRFIVVALNTDVLFNSLGYVYIIIIVNTPFSTLGLDVSQIYLKQQKSIDTICLVLYKTKMKVNNRNFLYKLSCIRKSAFSFLEGEMASVGVSDIPPSYGDILYAIYHQKTGYVNEIVEKSHKDKSTVSSIINQLEKKGYVEKLSDPDDGRRVKVRLTEQAEKYINVVSEISLKLQHKLFKNMSDEEQEILFLMLNKIEKNLK